MTPRDVSKALRMIEENYKDSFTPSFQPCIVDIARESANAIDALQEFVDFIHSLPSCNVCGNNNCKIKPLLGDTVRYNCFFFLKETE